MTNVTTLPGLKRPLTPTEAALIDLEHQEEAIAARRRALSGDPAVPVVETDKKAHPWPPEYVVELTRPVRIDIPFDDPVATREILELLMGAFVEAQQISQEHGIGFVNQRMAMRNVVKTAANMVVCKRGMKPRGFRGS